MTYSTQATFRRFALPAHFSAVGRPTAKASSNRLVRVWGPNVLGQVVCRWEVRDVQVASPAPKTVSTVDDNCMARATRIFLPWADRQWFWPTRTMQGRAV